jgi:hypothetical protein
MVRGSGRVPCPEEFRSGGALEPLLGPGAANDVVALPEPEAGTLGTVLLPERLEPFVDRLDLVDHSGIAPLGQGVPEGYPALAQRIDLFVEFRVDDHASFNAERAYPIPVIDNRSAPREEENRDHDAAADERGPGDDLERRRHS